MNKEKGIKNFKIMASLLLGLCLLTFAACTNDIYESPENIFVLDGKTYEITSAMQVFKGPADNSNKIFLYLVDDDYILGFVCYAKEDEKELAAGTYGKEGTFAPCTWSDGFVLKKRENKTEIDATISGGTIQIARSDKTYTITLDLTVNDKRLHGTYKGNLKWLEELETDNSSAVSASQIEKIAGLD